LIQKTIVGGILSDSGGKFLKRIQGDRLLSSLIVDVQDIGNREGKGVYNLRVKVTARFLAYSI
jgi:hypothetical protein